MRKVRLGVQVTQAMDARLQKAADAIGVSKSTLIVFCVGNYLANVEMMQTGLMEFAKHEISRMVQSEGPKDES